MQRALQQHPEYRSFWQAAQDIDTILKDHSISIQSRLELAKLYDQLSLSIHTLRPYFSKNALQDLEDAYFTMSQKIMRLSQFETPRKIYFREHFQNIWKTHFDLFVLSLQLFVLALFVGLFMGWHKPQYAELFLNQHMVERIMNHQDWFDGLRSSPIQGGFGIAINNIKVCINIFILSSLLAIGGIVLLIYNAFHVGYVISFCAKHSFDDVLLQFITTHGILELTLIVASSFAGLIMGREFFSKDLQSFQARFKQSSKEGVIVLIGLIPWIALAAVFEAFVSPFHYLSMPKKIFMASFIAACFWIYTFFPVKKTRT